jgi:putative membrane protein
MAAGIANLGSDVAFRGVLGGERADVGAASYTCRLTWREIVLSSLSGRTLVLTAAGFGAILSFLDDFGLAEKAAGLIGTLGVVAVIAIVVVSILIGWTISLAIEVVRLGGFTVRRRGTRIEIERGLVAHKTTGFGVRRIQAVRINEGLIRRQFGYAELLAITAGSGTSAGDQQNAVTPLHPFIRRDQVGEFLRQVAPELPQPADVEPLPRRGAWRWAAGPVIAMLGVVAGIAATRWMFGLLEADVAVTWATWALVLAALFVPLTIPLSLWSFRSAGFGLHQRAATVRSGAITRSTWVVPRERLQWASTSIGPIQRRQRLASITLAVASSGSGTTITAPSMDAESADSAIGELQDALEKRRQGA